MLKVWLVEIITCGLAVWLERNPVVFASFPLMEGDKSWLECSDTIN